jgi:hypothetical protein
MHVLVPAYIYPTPGGAWDQMAAAASKVSITAILNPDSGPGSGVDPNYVAAVNKLQAAGGRVIGYVHTSYDDGSISLATVEPQINDYRAWYHVNGIFVDEMTADANTQHVQYYEAIDQYAHQLQSGWTVVGNPGTTTTQDYARLPVADVIVNYENNTGYSSFTPPTWKANYPASRFANIVYGVSTVAAMQTDVSLAAHRDTGWLYVTDGNGTNPYGALPSYWNQFLTAIENTLITPATLNPPGNFTGQAVSASTVNLSWSAVSGATGYGVQQWENSTWMTIGTPSGTTWVATGLGAASINYFRVAAFDATSTSAFTNYISVLTRPASPTNVVATTVSTSQINLTWNAVGGVTSYYVYDRIGQGAWNWVQTLAVGQTSLAVPGLSAGVTYTFDVSANNAAGSSWSAIVSATTLVGLPPAPTNLTVRALSTSEAQLTWNPVAGATQYAVYIYKWNGYTYTRVEIGTIGGTACDINYLTAEATYYFAVAAINAAGTGQLSSYVSITMP